jgi:histidinol-phosphatase (PHP family)
MTTTNYHTHTKRCKHASGQVADYCRCAVAAGMHVLGFTDHTPLPDGRWGSVRMTMEELPDYCADLDRAREEFSDLLILKGMECDYAAEYVSFFRDELLGRYGLHYLVGAVHWFPYAGEWLGLYGTVMDPAMLRAYTTFLVEAMKSGLYAFIAHPDLFGACRPEWDEYTRDAAVEICRTAADLHLPLEINTYGFRKPGMETAAGERAKYPWPPFWEIAAEWNVPVVVNSDAHRPEDVLAAMDRGFKIVDKFGLHPVRLREIEEAAADSTRMAR